MSAWKIDDQPVEYQIRYWRLRAEKSEQDLHNKKLWHTPPERETFETLEKELRDARHTIESVSKDRDIWKKISTDESARVDLLESEGAAAVLKRERDHWRGSWRNCARRLANCMEHLGLDYTGDEPNADEL